jgi:hypothetical protein
MPITFSEPSTTPTSRNNNNLAVGATGPLAALYSNGYTPTVLQYPSDLGSAQKGHIVSFTACVTSGQSYEENNTYSFTDEITGGAEGFSISRAQNEAQRIAKGDNGTTKDVDQQTDLFWQPARKRGTDVISLYMPDTLNFAYNSSYSNLSVKDAVQSAITGIVGALGGDKAKDIASGAVSAVDSQIAKLGLNKAGKAINPMNQLVFDGIDFRSFQMTFQFTPKSAAESSQIQKIIQTFRSHAAPEISSGSGGMLFTVPDSWIIQFIQVGRGENPWVNKVKESVLEHIDVNYSPNGIWSTHPDGSPTQINLTLSFKEIQLVDRTQINKGY